MPLAAAAGRGTASSHDVVALLVRALSVDVAQIEIIRTRHAREAGSEVRITLTQVLAALRKRAERPLELYALRRRVVDVVRNHCAAVGFMNP